MKIRKEGESIVVAENKTEKVFLLNDFVEVVGVNGGKEEIVRGNIYKVRPLLYDLWIIIDTLEDSETRYIHIPSYLIKSIKKIPD